jgi:hypothetical protein
MASPPPRPGGSAGVPIGPSAAVQCRAMERPTRFEAHRWLGDKRTRVVHDLDGEAGAEHIADLMAARTYLAFGPDTLAEARNRGYHACRTCAAPAAADGDEDEG